MSQWEQEKDDTQTGREIKTSREISVLYHSPLSSLLVLLLIMPVRISLNVMDGGVTLSVSGGSVWIDVSFDPFK